MNITVRGNLQPVKLEIRNNRQIVVVDLNNFATFPTLAIGILVSALRNSGHGVKVISPLAYDVPAAERERQETIIDHYARRIHLSTRAGFADVRDALRSVRSWWNNRPDDRLLKAVEGALQAKPDAVLLSAYLQHFEVVKQISALCARRGIPVLLGGPMFNVSVTAQLWSRLPGVTAVVGSEVDRQLPDMVQALCSGGDLLHFPGVVLADGRNSGQAPPLRELDDTPLPDFTDFPWDRYRLKVIPVMTGRGCQWARCLFCSDVVSTSGRTFRTRSVESVLQELREQSRRHGTSNFLFLDIKLNSNPGMLRGIAEGIQDHVPGAQWVGTVHVDQRKDNGLSLRDLKAAAKSGMRRVSFGLESGSQKLLDAMEKGCTVERNAQFIENAFEAGISVRCTMFKGFPGETAHDLELTAEFLEQHEARIDRVRYNDFSVQADTPIELAVRESRYPTVRLTAWNARVARGSYRQTDADTRAYRQAKARVLKIVHRINRKEIRVVSRAFDGLM